MILCIDFDGVIHDYAHPKPGRKMGEPIAGAKESLELLKQKGHEIIIFTVKADSERGIQIVREWMEYYQIPFDSITNIKQNADYYIDDKAIRFEGNWDETNNKIIELY